MLRVNECLYGKYAIVSSCIISSSCIEWIKFLELIRMQEVICEEFQVEHFLSLENNSHIECFYIEYVWKSNLVISVALTLFYY